MRRVVALLATVTLAAAVLALSGSAASASSGAVLQTDPVGSYGCKTDTIAAKVINGRTYTATEKTCVEIIPGALIRAHGVTRCYRSGSPWNCLIINGDSVHTHLWVNGQLLAGTLAGDTDCSNCHENSHYSKYLQCFDGRVERFQAKEENLRVAWVSGHVSDLAGHTSHPVDLNC
jgi:hypothetical protein